MKSVEFSLDEVADYDQFSNIDSGKGRGLLLYTHKILKFKESKMDTEFEESMFVSAKLNSCDTLLIGLVYRSPSSHDPSSHDLLRKLTTEATTKGYIPTF